MQSDQPQSQPKGLQTLLVMQHGIAHRQSKFKPAPNVQMTFAKDLGKYRSPVIKFGKKS